jgi:hypothetical protein
MYIASNGLDALSLYCYCKSLTCSHKLYYFLRMHKPFSRNIAARLVHSSTYSS